MVCVSTDMFLLFGKLILLLLKIYSIFIGCGMDLPLLLSRCRGCGQPRLRY